MRSRRPPGLCETPGWRLLLFGGPDEPIGAIDDIADMNEALTVARRLLSIKPQALYAQVWKRGVFYKGVTLNAEGEIFYFSILPEASKGRPRGA